MNQSLVNTVRCLLIESDSEKKYWVHAARFAAFTLNRTMCSGTRKTLTTPFDLLHGKKPNISKMRIFGCNCFVLKNKGSHGKSDSKVDSCLFLGNCDNGYILKSLETLKIYRARNVKFLKPEEMQDDSQAESTDLILNTLGEEEVVVRNEVIELVDGNTDDKSNLYFESAQEEDTDGV